MAREPCMYGWKHDKDPVETRQGAIKSDDLDGMSTICSNSKKT